MNKKVIAGIVLVIVLIVLFFVFSKPENDEVIKIGYFGPLTGPVAGTSGEDIVNGFKLAAAQNNEVGNRKIEVIYEDDACDPPKAVSAAQKLINIDKVKILVSGVCSGSTMSVAPLAESNKVILFTPVSTSPKITDAGNYVFRTSASSVVTAEAVSSMLEKLAFKRVAVLFETADYTVGWKDSFIKKFTEDPTKSIALVESVGSKDPDMRTQLLKLAQTKPDAFIFIMNSTITANASLKQARELGITFPIVANEYFAFKEVVANPDAEGVFVSQYQYDPNASAFKDLISTYEQKYGKQPSQEIYTALAYDGYNVLFKAISECENDDPECIKSELYKIKNFSGVSGNITIDQKGDTQREFVLRKIQGGTLVDL